MTLTFADWGERVKGADGKLKGMVEMRAYHYHQPRVGKTLSFHADLIRPLSFQPRASKAEETWRTLTLDVSDQQVVARFGEAQVGVLTAEKKRVHSQGLTQWQPRELQRTFDFPTRGGIGLYLENCVASFRNVKVMPQ
jgi:hypothetical protein